MNAPDAAALLSPEALEAEMWRVGAERYHALHPFHALLHGGRLSRGQVQAWALNRYCYQEAIPRKDAAILSRMTDRTLRRAWVGRVLEHDGWGDDPGGIERWLLLTDALGLDREEVTCMHRALPATRFAVEAYVRFATEQPTLLAVASSLTELFAPDIHRARIEGMLAHYDFISENVLVYFRRRLRVAPEDVAWTLAWVKKEARTFSAQQAVLAALRFKCDVLWAQLDALHFAYVTPGLVPPGAFRIVDGNGEEDGP